MFIIFTSSCRLSLCNPVFCWTPCSRSRTHTHTHTHYAPPGNVTSFKLSPNLRKSFDKRDRDAEVEKLEKLLDSMKELDIQTGKPLYTSAPA